MSLKANKEALDRLEAEAKGRKEWGTVNLAAEARAELAALERALSVGALVLRGDLHVVPGGRLEEAARLMDAARQAEVLAEFAKEEA